MSLTTEQIAKLVKTAVAHEIKRKLPELVEQEVQKKMKPILKEIKKLREENQVLTESGINSVKQDPFTLAEQVLNSVREMEGGVVPDSNGTNKPLSKNPMLDTILRETRPFSSKERNPQPVGFEQKIPGYLAESADMEEWPTMGGGVMNTSTFNPATNAMPQDVKSRLAAEMGYGDMQSGPQKNGLGVKTGLAGLDRILNRDNSELVKRFKR